MPMPSTIASSEIVLAENPAASRIARVPIRLTGIATTGMIVARQLPRNRYTTPTTNTKAIPRVSTTSSMVAATKVLLS